MEIHVLPCHANYTGAAPVSEYFGPRLLPGATDTNDDGTRRVWESQFRGRHLFGRQLPFAKLNANCHIMSLKSSSVCSPDTESSSPGAYARSSPKAANYSAAEEFDCSGLDLEGFYEEPAPVNESRCPTVLTNRAGKSEKASQALILLQPEVHISTMTYWHHDDQPQPSDDFSQVLYCIQLQRSMHDYSDEY